MYSNLNAESTEGDRFCRHAAGLCVGLAIAALLGCEQADNRRADESIGQRLPALAALDAEAGEVVVAQGQLEPASGVISIMAPAGDRVAAITVSEGDSVSQGQVVGRLTSLEAREAELAVAEAQLQEARQRLASELSVGRAQLEAAKIELRKAELQLAQGTTEFERAEASGGRLALLQERVELAENKLQQLRRAADDPTAGRLVTASSLEQQELDVRQARSEWQSARQDALQTIETGKLSVEAAKQELEAARLALEAAETATPIKSLEGQVELLRLKRDATQLTSPIDGTVVAVHAVAGQATTGGPLIQVADTEEMICRVELNVADLQRIQIGSPARMSSPALAPILAGTVASISRMVGAPQLPNSYPMAAADWRSAEVIVALTDESDQEAASLINLQVDVAIKSE